MTVGIEILWPQALPTEPLLEAEASLRAAGIETSCRLLPVRRGSELSVLVLLTTATVEPLLKAAFARWGEQAAVALEGLVRRLLRRDPVAPGPPSAVVFESTASGARFVFTPGLPERAFRQALELDPGSEPGGWAWDPGARSWVRFDLTESRR